VPSLNGACACAIQKFCLCGIPWLLAEMMCKHTTLQMSLISRKRVLSLAPKKRNRKGQIPFLLRCPTLGPIWLCLQIFPHNMSEIWPRCTHRRAIRFRDPSTNVRVNEYLSHQSPKDVKPSPFFKQPLEQRVLYNAQQNTKSPQYLNAVRVEWRAAASGRMAVQFEWRVG